MKWFSHETDMLRNRKIRYVVRRHGVTGYGIWNALLEGLYKAEESFQIKVDAVWLGCFADDLKITDERTLIRVFDTLAEANLISSQLWAESIIYSESVYWKQMALRSPSGYQKHRDTVFKRDGFKCVYCQSDRYLGLDHVIPSSRGGSHEIENLVTACRTCNSSKCDRTPKEWLGGAS